MKSQKICLGLFVLMLLLSMALFGFKAKTVETVSLNGSVEKVDKDFKFVVVNDVKIFIARHTKIADEKGNVLKKEDLKPKAYLVTEVVRHGDGYHANRILIKPPRRGQ
jgi:hypothetical protein